MNNWSAFYKDVTAHVRALEDEGCDVPFFRGHSDSRWELRPSIARSQRKLSDTENIEQRIYYDFISLAGPLVTSNGSSWNTLFTMQHHGLPTRLLDWTSSFAAAIFFALKANPSMDGQPCIWVLDPYALNKITCSDAVLLTPPDDLMGSYYENFIVKEKTFDHDVLAINPIRINTRQVAQESTFTLFGNLSNSLNEIAPSALQRFDLPKEARVEAAEFVKMAGVNEFRLFPDLDGISRYITERNWNNA